MSGRRVKVSTEGWVRPLEVNVRGTQMGASITQTGGASILHVVQRGHDFRVGQRGGAERRRL